MNMNAGIHRNAVHLLNVVTQIMTSVTNDTNEVLLLRSKIDRFMFCVYWHTEAPKYNITDTSISLHTLVWVVICKVDESSTQPVHF